MSFILLITLSCIASIAQSELTSFLYTSENGTTWVEDLTKKASINATEENVDIYFFSKKQTNGVKFKVKDVSPIKNTDYSNSKTTFFVVHGWQNNHESESCWAVKNTLLSTHDVNVFLIDWHSISRFDYVIAQAAVVSIGQFVAEFIKLMVEKEGLSLDKTILVGHSLGAHVMGNAGAVLGGQVSIIMGLDPAGPLFTLLNTGNRLDKHDAKYVQAIHTNAGLLGIAMEVGHCDFWPNAGHFQPGCGLDATGLCSHMRSHEYFAESIKSDRFKAKKCTDYDAYEAGHCNNNAGTTMGMFTPDKSASGNYYLAVNSNSPYAKG